MNSRGFTLTETLVALAVLAVGLLAVAKMSVTYVRANTHSQQLGSATVLAQEKMEQLRSYSNSERADNFSVFDFDYLIADYTNFTTLADGTQVDGLLSGGNGGAPATNTAGTLYEVLFDDGAHGDGAAGDGVYGNQDTLTVGGTGAQISRRWTVEPLTINGSVEYAKVTVDTSWTDRTAQTRTVHLESVTHRRQ